MPWWQFIIVHHISIHMSLIFSVSAPLCRHFRQNVSHQEHPRIYVFFLRMNTPQELSTRICMVKVFLGPTFWQHLWTLRRSTPPPSQKNAKFRIEDAQQIASSLVQLLLKHSEYMQLQLFQMFQAIWGLMGWCPRNHWRNTAVFCHLLWLS